MTDFARRNTIARDDIGADIGADSAADIAMLDSAADSANVRRMLSVHFPMVSSVDCSPVHFMFTAP
jgi:hypothetical protein